MRRLTQAAAALACVSLLIGGCSRHKARAPQAAAVADTLRNGLPSALVPKLAAWVANWRHADPDFSPESLVRGDSDPYQFDAAWRGAGHISDGVRSRALVDVLSPDSVRSLDFDMYLEFDGGPDGVSLGREPDSAPILADFKADTVWRVAFCGTPCSFDGAYWIDAERFVLSGATESGAGAQADAPWSAFLDVYDLRSRRMTRWLASTVAGPAFRRYVSASDSELTARVERAGFGKQTGSTGSRVDLSSSE